MGLVAKNSGGDFEKAPAGMHVARCVRLIDLGTQINEKFNKEQHKIRIYWELPNTKISSGEFAGNPFIVQKQYTLSLNEKADLRSDLRSWRGRDFTEQELEGFDLENILDKCCFLNVVHDGDYANVAAITPLATGTECPPRVHDLVMFDLTRFNQQVFDGLSDRLKQTIMQSKEMQHRTQGAEPESQPANPPADFDDDIPF